MKHITSALLALFLLSAFSSAYAKQYDLVLVHGLANKHKWSSSFLTELANTWGSGNIYVIYTNTSTNVYTKSYNGRTVTFIGKNDYKAGKDYIQKQAQNMDAKINILKNHYGLSNKFNIIAHSMGGLVSRYYAYYRPNTVAGIVTLGRRIMAHPWRTISTGSPTTFSTPRMLPTTCALPISGTPSIHSTLLAVHRSMPAAASTPFVAIATAMIAGAGAASWLLVGTG